MAALKLLQIGGKSLVKKIGGIKSANNTSFSPKNALKETYESLVDSTSGLINAVAGFAFINLYEPLLDFVSVESTLSEENMKKVEDSVKSVSSVNLVEIEKAVNEIQAEPSKVDDYKIDVSESLVDVLRASANANANLMEQHVKATNSLSIAVQGLIAVISHASDINNTQMVLQTATMGHIADATANSTSGTSSVNVTNEIDLSELTTAVSTLGEHINTQERQSYFTSATKVSDFQHTETTFSDLLGNDTVTSTPMQVKAMKDLAQAKGEADENDFELDDDLFDTFPDLTKLADLFAFQGLDYDITQNFGSTT